MKKCKMVSVFAGNHSASRRGFLRLSRVPPTSRVFTSGYVNHFTLLQSEDVLSAGEQEQQMSYTTPVRRYFKQGSVSK